MSFWAINQQPICRMKTPRPNLCAINSIIALFIGANAKKLVVGNKK